ncbi:hypothetical protein PGT21_002256 [Puccinia graminis f. sp. tritici]|uniref:Uncharacterized protein n=1 Tax=Puccinia graminis f. sp. tritici TaxID=56615 RepID=A0A5B0PQW7_PUCGR|nr:hypothetical protein PGT21_002256 [Puccinia graminis f. sp. tritici]
MPEPDHMAMAVDSPTRDDVSTTFTPSDATPILNHPTHAYNARRESPIEADEALAPRSPFESVATPNTAITAVRPNRTASNGARLEENAVIDPPREATDHTNPTHQASHAYPVRQATQMEEDEVPSYPPPPYVHAVRFALTGPYTTPATAGPPRSIVDPGPRRVYSTPRHTGSASPDSPTRPNVRRRLFVTSPAPTRAAPPGGSPAPPTDPPTTPHPSPAGDPFDMDARFSAQFLAMSFYNTLLSVHDVLGDLADDHPHFLRHEIMRSATIIAEDWFNYHRIHLPAQFAEPHSMGHLVAGSVRFTVRCLNALILECPDLYPSIPPLSPTS